MDHSKIRVLIVDDSAVVRQTLAYVLAQDPEIEVIGTAGDPYAAAEKIAEQIPDVITLDIEMPRMDGLTFLRKVMTQHPIPVVICSSLAEEGTQSALEALESGAVEIVTKPRLGVRQFLEDSRTTLCDAVKAAAGARLRRPGPQAHRGTEADRGCSSGAGGGSYGKDHRESRDDRRFNRGNGSSEDAAGGACRRIRRGSRSCSTCRSCSHGRSPPGWTDPARSR